MKDLDYWAFWHSFSMQARGGSQGGGGGTLIFSYIRRLGFYFFGFKFLNFNIFGVFQKSEYFLGMKILWIIFWVHPKIGLVLGVISMYFKVFFKLNIQNRGIFWVAKVSNIA